MSRIKKSYRIGIDNYSLNPLGLSPLEQLRWAKNHACAGVAFSGIEAKFHSLIDSHYLKSLSEYASENDLYIEWGGGRHIPRDMKSWDKTSLANSNEKAAKEAEALGTRIVRSCSGGLMRWNDDSPATETLMQETANILISQKQMLADHNVILAIETHFEFTTFELLRIFEMCDAVPGEYLGICLDTMNLLTMLEEPVAAIERILPWIVSTHIKDGGLIQTAEGFTTFPAAIGTGLIDIRTIVNINDTLSRGVNLSIESHGGEFQLPVYNRLFMSKFPDLTVQEFVKLMELAHKCKDKISSGELEITSRDEWPEVCEERVTRDIESLKNILQV